MSTAVAALSWAVFDHMLTFGDEVALVWNKRPIRAPAVLFLIVRYSSLVLLVATVKALTVPHGDTEFNMDQTWMEVTASFRVPQLVLMWLIEILLQTRIYALYGNRWLTVFNVLAFMVGVCATASCALTPSCQSRLLAFLLLHGTVLKYPSLASAGTSINNLLYIIPGLSFEIWLAVLAASKLKKEVQSRELLSVIAYDSIVHVLFMIAVMLVYEIMGVVHIHIPEDKDTMNTTSEALIWPFIIASQSIGASRLFLHLRKAYYRAQEYESSVYASMRGSTLPAFTRVDSTRTRRTRISFMSSLVDDSFFEPDVELKALVVEASSRSRSSLQSRSDFVH